MQKGKKFSAAEKHFQEKEVKYQKQIQQLKQTILQMNEIESGMVQEAHKLRQENAQLHEWIERLLTYTELSLDDIKAACEQDKKRGEAMVGFMNMAGMMGKYLG